MRHPQPITWFLDIDGTISPLDRGQPGLVSIEIGGWYGHILISPTIFARIRDLGRARCVQIEWLTEWEYDANKILSPRTGLDPYPTHVEPVPASARMWWKERVVRDHANKGRRFIWTDDELPDNTNVLDLRRDNPESLIVIPNSLSGLTHEHLDQIEKFANEGP